MFTHVTEDVKLNTVTCIPIVRQRLGKHALSTTEDVFSAWSMQSVPCIHIVRQRLGKHALSTTEDVFSAWSIQSGYNKCSAAPRSREQ
jgi:hypothetical protein